VATTRLSPTFPSLSTKPKTSDKGSVTVAEHSRAQSDEPFGSVRAAMSD
jgi:hypothetical protein